MEKKKLTCWISELRSSERELIRQRNININLRRQLEKCRKDVVEYCAKFCEEHEVPDGASPGQFYAKALRSMIGK